MITIPRELNVKTTKRPNLNDLEIGDILHVGTEEKGEIFKVKKTGEKEYVMERSGELVSYSRGVMNKNISSFAERYKAIYWITR